MIRKIELPISPAAKIHTALFAAQRLSQEWIEANSVCFGLRFPLIDEK